ncbi:MAG: hypothetical protein JXC31_01760 [Acholeplasmataceae bacterium]|nr:hypothetical protein [Acholeplasmataceae bacterium]
MAYYNEDQLFRYFDKAIKREAQKRIEELEKEIDYLYSKEMKSITDKLEASKNIELSKKLKEMQLYYHDKINQTSIGYDAKLIKERTLMTNIVFHNVLDKIYQFITSPEYETLMTEKLRILNRKYPNTKSMITISDHDTHLVKIIGETITSPHDIIKSPQIHLGGFEFLLSNEGVEIDETIDTKFAEQKEWFYKNSKLFIRS